MNGSNRKATRRFEASGRAVLFFRLSLISDHFDGKTEQGIDPVDVFGATRTALIIGDWYVSKHKNVVQF